MANQIDLLARPVYGMAQVDWILGLHPGTARRWIDGYQRSNKTYPPVVRPESTGDLIVTWGEFTETRLLSEFRGAGVPMQRMRPAVERLREQLNTRYPLALAKPWLTPAGRELVLTIQEEVNLDKKLLMVVVRNDQLMLTLPVDQYVLSADFDDQGIARRIRPVATLDHVWLDPLRQFGEPVVRSVPTEVIAEQVRAGERQHTIAQLYELSDEQVEQAVAYELIRREGAAPAA
jgi:uncharacterized protein (DUF433 family)